jgi:hypothetical protein
MSVTAPASTTAVGQELVALCRGGQLGRGQQTVLAKIVSIESSGSPACPPR